MKSLTNLVLLCAIILFVSCKSKDVVKDPAGRDDEIISFPSEKVRYVSANGGLRLRAEPNLNSPVVFLVPYCSHVFQGGHTIKTETIDGLTGRWAKLRYHGPRTSDRGEGWAFEPYLIDETPPVPITQKSISSFKSGCFSITGGSTCMGCGSIEFHPDGTFQIAYDCHMFGDGTWQIQQDKIMVNSSQYIGVCGHFKDPLACENAPKKPDVHYEFKVDSQNNWYVKTDSLQWKANDRLNWSKQWNNVGKMRCLIDK